MFEHDYVVLGTKQVDVGPGRPWYPCYETELYCQECDIGLYFVAIQPEVSRTYVSGEYIARHLGESKEE